MRLKNLLLIILLFSAKLNAFSQDFEVSPAELNYYLDPFESAIKNISITNHSNKHSIFTISFSDFVFDKDGNAQAVKANTTENSCSDWLMPNVDVFEVAPNQTFTLNISMNVPIEDYKARWSYLYIQAVNEKTSYSVDKSVKTGLNLTARIAIKVFRSPKTTQKSNMEISNLEEVNNEKYNTRNNKKRFFSVDITNKGLEIYNAKVLFIASNLSTAKEYELDEIKLKLYPGYLRKLTYMLDENDLPEGEFSFVALLDYGSKHTLKGTRLNKTLHIVK